MIIINVTPHEINLVSSADGAEPYAVPSTAVISAAVVEENAGFTACGATLVKTKFVADANNEAILASLEEKYPGAIILGSIIAAQAFPGRILAMCPAPGYERVPPAEKRMRDDKFTTFGGDCS